MQNVAYLLAVTEDGDVAAEDRGYDEPRQPALILHAELTRTVYAGLPERGRRQFVDPGEIEGVLVGRTLGAAIGRKQVERLGLADAVWAVDVGVTVAAQLGLRGGKLAVNLVGRCVDEHCFGTMHPCGVEHVERAEGIDAEIGPRVSHRRRDGYLGRQMQNGVEPVARE